MNNKYQKYLSAAILSFGFIFSAVLIGNAFAQTDSTVDPLANIQYPIAELGNCPDANACKIYCDKIDNREACFAFAQKNNLMDKEEIASAKKFMAIGKGPGNCTTREVCENYCNDVSHIDECVSFAEKTGVLGQKDLEEAQKVRAAIKSGVKPPACTNRKECDVYCSSADHMEECITFANAAGLMNDKEKQESQKVLQAIRKGIKPPACKGKKECDLYCSTPDHIEECMTFAKTAGMIDEKEQQNAEKFIQAIKKGVKAPACKGKEQCDLYCAEESHMEECMKFAEAAGFMTAQEVEMARKTGGKGPGGCRGKDQCEAFCSDPNNQETCLNFAKENNLIKQEDLQKMEAGKMQFQNMLNQAPAKVTECLTTAFGTDLMEKIKSSAAMPPRDMEGKIRVCFEGVMGGGAMQPGQNGLPSTAGGGAPMNFENMPPKVVECLKSTAGENIVEQLKSGTLQPGPEIGEKIRSCFMQIAPQEVSGTSSMGLPGNMIRPLIPNGIKQMLPGVQPMPKLPEKMMNQIPEEQRQMIEERIGQEMQNRIQQAPEGQIPFQMQPQQIPQFPTNMPTPEQQQQMMQQYRQIAPQPQITPMPMQPVIPQQQ